ncbi:hypothetical protein [Deinococcus hopiensis]|uniref:hypothetical protein n=1 Tax=Deinococcus hopiensis TaxID=309885 RepID=UPI003CCC0420
MTQRILSTTTSAGAVHDLELLGQSGVRFPHQTALIGDAGYQACGEATGPPSLPIRRRERPPLSAEQRQDNRVLALLSRGPYM